MFRNYLVTALRNIVRHRLYGFINIGGLAVGLACVIFVLIFIRDELSYDTWLSGTENLFRVEKIARPPGRDILEIATGPFPVAAAMRDGIPEVTAMTRINYTSMTLMAGDRTFRQDVVAVDPNVFQVIKLPLVKGGPADVFKHPESVVLSESAARKYFGTADPIGKFIRTTANCEMGDAECGGRLVPLKVTGILQDIPHNSHLDGEVFIPNTSIADRMPQSAKQSWIMNSYYSYVVLAPDAAPKTVMSKLAPLLDRAVTEVNGVRVKGSQRYSFHLTPFTDVHLTSGRWLGNQKPAGSWTTLYGVAIVGLLILFVACFNFTNLATAMASFRAREIALRKTFGANRAQLIIQFLGEAVLTALLSLVLALAMVEVLLPAFGRLLQRPVAISYTGDGSLLLAIVGITVVAGLIGGSYPAMALSRFRPSATLRTGNAGRTGSGRLQSVLVVLQFAVSIALGISVLVVFSQITFARNIELGFRKDNMVVVSGIGLLTIGGRESFVQRLRANPGVQDVAMIEWPPFNRSIALMSVKLPGHPEDIALYRRVIGTNAVPLLGMKLVAGRLLSDKRGQDEIDTEKFTTGLPGNEDHNLLIDEAAAAKLGFTPEQAVGKTLLWNKSAVRIVGVLANAKFEGAREAPKATIYVYDPKLPAFAVIRMRPDGMPQTLSFIDRTWRDFAPTKAIFRYFLDDEFGRLYQADERQGEMFGAFVAVAIFISCLGLFGLAALTASRRTREIGIRKAFGARTRDLVFLLLWQFSIPVLIANAIAWPLAWYYLHGWLQGFAYRIPLSPLYFIGAGLAALLIAWATVCFHACRVAQANPIYALRHE